MPKTRDKKRTALACELSALTLVLGAMAPLPAAVSMFGGVSEARAQTNPCAPKPPPKLAPVNPCAPQTQKATPVNPCAPKKAAPLNPCAPQKAAPTNPCAPKAANSKASDVKTTKDHCKGPVNPCAPTAGCDKDDKH